MLQNILTSRRPDIQSALLYGATKKTDRDIAMKSRVIFSSYHMASEALDIPTLSGLVFATPKPAISKQRKCNAFVQALYRVIRGKVQAKDPVIVEFRDNHRMWWSYTNSRLGFYKSQNKSRHVFVMQRIKLKADPDNPNVWEEVLEFDDSQQTSSLSTVKGNGSDHQSFGNPKNESLTNNLPKRLGSNADSIGKADSIGSNDPFASLNSLTCKKNGNVSSTTTKSKKKQKRKREIDTCTMTTNQTADRSAKLWKVDLQSLQPFELEMI